MEWFFFSNNLLDLIIYPHSYILPDIFFFHLNPLVSVKIFSFIFLKTVVTILKLLKSIYNDVSKTKKKLFLFFGGLLCANTHYNKTRTQKKIYLYILYIWIMWPSGFDYLYNNNYFFNVITQDAEMVRMFRVMNFCEGREYILVMLVPWLIFYWPISTF